MELENQDGCERRSSRDENPLDDETRNLDLRPEFCHYPDEGCDLAKSCLNCPFENCIYEKPGGKTRLAQRLRNEEIARLHFKEGKTLKELANLFGVSERTVARALRAAKSK